jgi:hypothetical protein
MASKKNRDSLMEHASFPSYYFAIAVWNRILTFLRSSESRDAGVAEKSRPLNLATFWLREDLREFTFTFPHTFFGSADRSEADRTLDRAGAALE